MKSNIKILLVLCSTLLLSACSADNGSNNGFFHTYLVSPFINALEIIASLFNGNYGLSIIVVTIIIRLILMPMMLKQTKKQQEMKVKMDMLKPELEVIQKKLKETKDQKEQQSLQQEMLGLYQKHNVNPLSIGCLPILIQMPVLMGFYYAISSSSEIATHSFLWFSLGQSDIWITAIAGIVYFLQYKVSSLNLPEDQRKQMKMMGLISPLMIVIVSLNAPAALPLYWSVGGLFLIFQTQLARVLYKPKELIKVGQ